VIEIRRIAPTEDVHFLTMRKFFQSYASFDAKWNMDDEDSGG